MGCPAVAVGPWLGRRRWFAPLDHLAIVLGDHPGHVGHCPVRDFHRVPVDDRSKRMANGEAGVDDGQEGGGHVGLDRFVETTSREKSNVRILCNKTYSVQAI